MNQLIKYTTEAGDIFIESNKNGGVNTDGKDYIHNGLTEKTVAGMTKKLDDSLSKIQYISKRIIKSIHKKSDNTPHSISVEFGVKIGGDADFIIASGNTEANFKISFTWQKQ